MMDSLLAAAQESGSDGSSFSTIWFLIGAAGLWKMFTKMGEPGWTGIIPLYRDYKLCEKVMGDPWYWLREFVVIIPVIGWIGALYFRFQIGKATARAFGKPDSWAWGYTFLDAVFYCITGFDTSDYYGIYGSGDRRTGEARGARTVDFDVVKDNDRKQSYSGQPDADMYRARTEVRANQVDDDVVINGVRDVDFDTIKNDTNKESEVEFAFNQDESGE